MHISQSFIHRKRTGIALIAVLWVIGFLTTLLVVTLTLLKVDVDENVADLQSYTAWQQAHTGLSFGMHPGVERDDPLLQFQSSEYDEGYAVLIEPEAARLNINAVLQSTDKQLLVNLFRLWGMEDDRVEELIDALKDWVDADALENLNGAEERYYREQGYSDRPYNRPFANLDEMALVRGFSEIEELQPRWREYFSLWSEAQLDIHEASVDLLVAAAEVSMGDALEYRARVAGDDGKMGTEDDVRYPTVEAALNDMNAPSTNREFIQQRFIVSGSILRVESEGYSGNFRYLIKSIISAKGPQASILDYQEKQLSSE